MKLHCKFFQLSVITFEKSQGVQIVSVTRNTQRSSQFRDPFLLNVFNYYLIRVKQGTTRVCLDWYSAGLYLMGFVKQTTNISLVVKYFIVCTHVQSGK